MKGQEEYKIILAIETSCDETSVAIIRRGRELLSDIISTQIPVHRRFGGVVPEIASRKHLEMINSIAEQALEEAGLGWDEIDAVAVTRGPGLVGALLVGVATAKAYAFALGKDLIAVHHMAGHIAANYLQYPDLAPPFVCLTASGGHTSLIHVSDYNSYEVLGETRDDAAGEAFDKVARVLALGYPGGPAIEAAAKEGNPEAYPLKRVMLEKDSLDFSFSGLKTAVLNLVNNAQQRGEAVDAKDMAASFQQAVIDVMVAKSIDAVRRYREDKLVLAGGVAANESLRRELEKACEKEGIALYAPDKLLCTDNAAMIGSAGYYYAKEHGKTDMTVDATATWDLEDYAHGPEFFEISQA